MAVLLVERERWLRRRRVPDYRPQRLHPHGHVHVLLRQHAHQGHLVEEVPDAHAGSFVVAFCVCVCVVFAMGCLGRMRSARERSRDVSCPSVFYAHLPVWSIFQGLPVSGRRSGRAAKAHCVQPKFHDSVRELRTAARTQLGSCCALARFVWYMFRRWPFQTARLLVAFVPQMVQFVCMTTQALYLMATG